MAGASRVIILQIMSSLIYVSSPPVKGAAIPHVPFIDLPPCLVTAFTVGLWSVWPKVPILWYTIV